MWREKKGKGKRKNKLRRDKENQSPTIYRQS